LKIGISRVGLNGPILPPWAFTISWGNDNPKLSPFPSLFGVKNGCQSIYPESFSGNSATLLSGLGWPDLFARQLGHSQLGRYIGFVELPTSILNFNCPAYRHQRLFIRDSKSPLKIFIEIELVTSPIWSVELQVYVHMWLEGLWPGRRDDIFLFDTSGFERALGSRLLPKARCLC